jgi:hypothetical protein
MLTKADLQCLVRGGLLLTLQSTGPSNVPDLLPGTVRIESTVRLKKRRERPAYAMVTLVATISRCR